MNYGYVEDVKADSRLSRRRLFAKAVICLSLAVFLVCGVLLVLELMRQSAVEGMSDEFRPPSEQIDDIGGLRDSEGSQTASAEPDWSGIEESALVPASAWVTVDNTGIDYAVAQWDDNEYGLHHDIYGNWSWAGVFADCDADMDGRNVVVYGHTLYGGGMFTPLSTAARDQSTFDSVGSLHYSTPGQGWREYVPAFALDVNPSFTDVRRFDFTSDTAGALQSLLMSKQMSSEANVVVGVDSVDDTGLKHVSDADEIDQSRAVQLTPSLWYEATDADMAELSDIASDAAFRGWLQDMYGYATCSSYDVDAKLASAERCVVLACCSWPFNNHRTLVFFTAA